MISLSIVLFGFWVILSGKFDAFHLTLGILSSAGVAMATRSLWHLPPKTAGLHARTWQGWLTYVPWLLKEIFWSAVDVVKVVADPALPIDPKLIHFETKLPHTIAHLTLANSITLTPGTVTINVEDETYTIHALTQPAAAALTPEKGEGEMQARVRRLFNAWTKS